MTEHYFIEHMRIGIPPLARPIAPAAHRCECNPTNNHVCDDCEAIDHALRQHARSEDHIE